MGKGKLRQCSQGRRGLGLGQAAPSLLTVRSPAVLVNALAAWCPAPAFATLLHACAAVTQLCSTRQQTSSMLRHRKAQRADQRLWQQAAWKPC